MKQSNSPHCFLFDNGSLRASSTLRLRQTAAALYDFLKVSVTPVSLLHSSGVDPAQLDGTPARLLETALTEFLEKVPNAAVVLLPFFFGPSAALVEYVPERLEFLRTKFPEAELILADCLMNVHETDERMAQALADATRDRINQENLKRPKIILVDHGSPRAEVTAVRDHLGNQLHRLLGPEVERVGVASMERRPGSKFAFNEPLLETALTTPPFDHGEVVVILQFLSPGRHAGESGDIAEICSNAQKARPGLRTYRTEPIGQDPRVLAVLADRYREAAQSILRGSIKPTSSA